MSKKLKKHDKMFASLRAEMLMKFDRVDEQFRFMFEIISSLGQKLDRHCEESKQWHQEILIRLDAATKKEDTNERELLFLGHQHGRLEKRYNHLEGFCHDKISFQPIDPA